MNITLVSNAPTPKICEKLHIKSSPKEGWVSGLVDSLKNEQINLFFVFPHRLGKKCVSGEVDKVKYFGYPKTKNKDWEYEEIHKKYFLDIFQRIGYTDVIHIMGTEMGHTLSAVEAAQELGILDKVVISIQGLTSVYARHYYAGLPEDVIKRATIRDMLKHDNIAFGKKIYEKRGQYEIEALKKVKHIIGRTDWDKACTFLINPQAEYHFCNETLRSVFYSGSWNYTECEPYTIFVSQGNYPIKGFHYMLEALFYVKRFYPNVKLRITGTNPRTDSIIKRQKRNAYVNYIEQLINEYNLENNIEFLGILNAEEMKAEYLRANVFVSPSAIENSPNSVGEAMILGTPVITSDVGGVKNLISHINEGYIYQSDAPYMLAYYIIEVFKAGRQIELMSNQARLHARRTHDQNANTKQIMKVYAQIAKGKV